MIGLSILAILFTLVILAQNPKGKNKLLTSRTGAKGNHSLLSKTTWSLAIGLVVLTLVLY